MTLSTLSSSHYTEPSQKVSMSISNSVLFTCNNTALVEFLYPEMKPPVV